MEIERILKSRRGGLHWMMMLAETAPFAAYPGKTPAPRAGILKRLEALDAQTRDTIDTLADRLRAQPFPAGLSPEALYMLRQRLQCATDVLERLSDSSPEWGWIGAADDRLEQEDRWLLIGIWREFGPFWLQNLAWRISRGLPE